MILQGLSGAIERYRHALAVERGLILRVCVGEALWWACSGDEFLRDRAGGGVEKKIWYSQLQRTEAGAVLAGLVYARHRAGHEHAHLLAATVAATTGYTVEHPDGSTHAAEVRVHLTYGMRPSDLVPGGGFKFESLELVSRDGDRSAEKNLGRDKCYDEHVAGRPVIDVFEQVLDAFKATLQIEWTNDDHVAVRLNGCHPWGIL